MARVQASLSRQLPDVQPSQSDVTLIMDLPRIDEGRTAELFAWDDARVLKLYRTEFPRHWADWEAKITRAIGEAGVPAPQVFEVLEVEGRRGIIMERVHGPSMIADLLTNLLNVVKHARLLAELHARMHERTIPDLPSQRECLRQRIQEAKLSSEIQAAALQRLDRLPEGTALCHGDFHPGNVVLTAHGPRILDWPTAMCGNPLGDVARTSLILRLLEPSPEMSIPWALRLVRDIFHATYLWRYRQLRSVSREAIEAWLLPVAVARTLENVVYERENLPRLIYSLMNHVQPD
jgi:aminoglycoside phosphotransferase (APT) family kinase protein